MTDPAVECVSQQLEEYRLASTGLVEPGPILRQVLKSESFEFAEKMVEAIRSYMGIKEGDPIPGLMVEERHWPGARRYVSEWRSA